MLFGHHPGLPILRKLNQLARAKGVELFLVGGCLRDAVLARPFQEFDLAAVGDFSGFLEGLSSEKGVKVIPLDKERGIYRLFFPMEQRLFFDLSRCEKNSIEEDLLCRDFSINAMGLSVEELLLGKTAMLDPQNGMKDLKKKLVRTRSPEILKADPVRLLRAFRFAAVLNGSIEEKTVQYIKDLSGLIGTVAGERIREELFKIFSVPKSHPWMARLYQTGLLAGIFPEVLAMQATGQDKRFHEYDVWEHSLETLRCLEDIFSREKYRGVVSEEMISVDRSIKACLKFVSLFHDIAKPFTRSQDENGHVHFYGHEKMGEKMVSDLCRRLKLSRKETAFAALLVREHLKPGLLSRSQKVSKAVPRLFRSASPYAIELLFLSLADALSKGNLFDEATSFIEKLILEEYPRFEKGRLKPILTGKDLLSFGLKEGPLVGSILRKVEEARFTGLIKNKREAIRLVKMLQIGNK